MSESKMDKLLEAQSKLEHELFVAVSRFNEDYPGFFVQTVMVQYDKKHPVKVLTKVFVQ